MLGLKLNRSPTVLRRPRLADETRFVELMLASQSLHHPWIFPPTSRAQFRDYLKRMGRADHEGFLVCTRDTGDIVGVININNIVRGAFLSGSLGYYAVTGHAGRGLMSDGLQQVIRHAFGKLGLHRLEANIQPANQPSKALVRQAQFTLEGVSKDFLFIAGAWRDHERWVLLNQRGSLH